MSHSLDVTRSQLRRYLIPDAPDDAEIGGDQFPRSKVMRFMVDPRNRHLLVFSGSILAVLVTRMVGTNGLSVVTEIARSFAKRRN